MIGVVGGLGPYAGLDLVKKIFDNTTASTDQDHLPVVLVSIPTIESRVDFLEGRSSINPAYGIFDAVKRLEASGATVAGIACNTAHTEKIISVVLEKMEEGKIRLKLLNLVEEVSHFIIENFSDVRKVGLMCRLPTYGAGIYQSELKARGLEVIEPSDEGKKKIDNAVGDPEYGIKAFSNPVTEKAKKALVEVSEKLVDNGAELVILACTEFPLALVGGWIKGVFLLDPTEIFARALIREENPAKLRARSPARARP